MSTQHVPNIFDSLTKILAAPVNENFQFLLDLGISSGLVPTKSFIADLQAAITGTNYYVAGRNSLNDDYRGYFIWTPGDQSAFVSLDLTQGIFVAPSSDPTGRSGAWVRSVPDSIYNIKIFGIPNTTVTITNELGTFQVYNITAITQYASNLLSAMGGGVLLFPVGNWGLQNIFPMPNVTYRGSDRHNTKIFTIQNLANTAHPFIVQGHYRNNYYQRVLYNLVAVAPGNTVTTNNPSDASNFNVGDYVIVMSSSNQTYTQGNDWQPLYAIARRIISKSGAILTLDKPIYDSIPVVTGAFPRICKYNQFTVQNSNNIDQWAINNIWENFTFIGSTSLSNNVSDQLVGGGATTIYNSIIRNIDMYCIDLCAAWNGLTDSDVHDINVYNMHTTNNTMRMLEIKTGSYNSRIYNIYAESGDASTCSIAPLETGEYASRIKISNITMNFLNMYFTYQYMIGSLSSANNFIEWDGITINGYSISALLTPATIGITGVQSSVVGLVYKNIEINAPYCAQAVRVIPNAPGTTSNFIVDGVISKQPLASDPINHYTVGSIVFNDIDGSTDCIIKNVIANGPIVNVSTKALVSGSSITTSNCKVAGFSNLRSSDPTLAIQFWQLGFNNIERFGDYPIQTGKIQTLTNISTSSTTANNVMAQTAFPNYNAFNWSIGDEIIFDIDVYVSGTNNTKNFALYDVNAAHTIGTFTATAAQTSANTGIYNIKGKIIITSVILTGGSQGITYEGVIAIVGGSTASNYANAYNVFQNTPVIAPNFQIQGWVANASDVVNVSRADIHVNPFGKARY